MLLHFILLIQYITLIHFLVLNHLAISYMIMVHNNMYICLDFIYQHFVEVFFFVIYQARWPKLSCSFFLINLYFFYRRFWFSAKLNRKYRQFPYNPCIHTCTHSPTVNIPTQSGIFVIINKLALKHSYHPKSTFYIRVHTWCSTV